MEKVVPAPFGGEGSSGVLSLIASLLRLVSREEDPVPIDGDQLLEIRNSVASIAWLVLDAQSLEDLDARVDTSLNTAEFGFLARMAVELGKKTITGEIKGPTRDALPRMREEFVDTLGQGCVRQVEEAFKLVDVIVNALPTGKEMSADLPPVNPLALVRDPSTPPELARTLIAPYEVLVCTLVIAHIRHSGERPAPWLLRGIADLWLAALRNLTRAIASMPGASVSENLLPKNERLNVEEAVQRQQEFTRLSAEGLKLAEASGMPVFPDDDEAI